MQRATFVVSLRALGYVALLSSLVSPDRLTALLRMGQPEAGPVPVVLAEWMVAVGNLLGGIALLAGRSWGRWVLVVASAIGVVAALLAFVVPEAQVLRYGPPQSVWIVVDGSVGAAAVWASGPRVVLGQWRSLANVSYAFLGLVAVWGSHVLYLYFRPPSADASSNAAGLGFFVAIPFGAAAAIALVVASSQSLVGWRDLRLVAMLALTISFGVYLGSGWKYEWVPWAIYGLANIAIAMTPPLKLRRDR